MPAYLGSWVGLFCPCVCWPLMLSSCSSLNFPRICEQLWPVIFGLSLGTEFSIFHLFPCKKSSYHLETSKPRVPSVDPRLGHRNSSDMHDAPGRTEWTGTRIEGGGKGRDPITGVRSSEDSQPKKPKDCRDRDPGQERDRGRGRNDNNLIMRKAHAEENMPGTTPAATT